MSIPPRQKQILKKYENIIKDVEFLPIKREKQFRIKITFMDNMNLRISEIIDEGDSSDYSYYYLDEKNQLIIGWVSAPHHKHLKNFPYHKHVGKTRKLEYSTLLRWSWRKL